MKEKLKIAIYSGSIPSTTFVEHLVKGIAKHHEVLLFGRLNTPVQYASENIKIYSTPESHILNLVYSLYRVSLLAFKKPGAIPKLLKQTKKYKGLYNRWIWFTKALPIVVYQPDVFHIQWAKSLEQYFFLKTDFNIPIVLSLRGAHINYSPIASKALAASYCQQFPKVNGFHAVSKAIAQEAQKYNAAPERIKVIYSILPDHFFKAFESYKKKRDEVFRLISIGRPHWIKGYSYAIQAMGLLKQQHFNFNYTIIGIDEPDEELLFLIHSLGLEKHIQLLPSLPQAELMATLHSYDALILSSLKEGIANVVLEAMAIGLPVISTDCGGMAEVVKNEVNGFLVPIRNPRAMANAVRALSNMEEPESQHLTLHAHENIKEKFRSLKSVDHFLELYKDAIDSN